MATGPLVSAVMPCLNAGRMLRAALGSLIRQTHENLEIVFVDNGSTDGSDRLAQEIGAASGRAFRYLACPERGANRARIRGFEAARGDYIQWMDADDEMNPDKIALQVGALERHRDFDIAYCDWVTRRHDRGDPPIEIPHEIEQVHDQIRRTLSGVWYPPHAHLLRRAAAQRLHEAQAWWPERGVATDVEYFAIAALLGYRFLHVPGARVLYNVAALENQISVAIPYTVRVLSLRDIYARLGSVAEMPAVKPRVTGRHRALLRQNWDLWTLPHGSVELTKRGGREFRLLHRASGKTLKLRPREAAAVEALGRVSIPMTLAHLAPHLMEAMGGTAIERGTVIALLERLREAGILARATSIDRLALEAGGAAAADAGTAAASRSGQTGVAGDALVSVVIPCFNGAEMLPRALKSVVAQSHRNIEIIVVDNGSTDGSDRIAREIGNACGRTFKFAVCPERGVNRARNLGFGMAEGQYVQWLDSDDELDPEKIARQVEALERDRSCDIAYGDWTLRIIYGEGRPTVVVRKTLEETEDQILRILAGHWYPPHVYLLRRAVAERLDQERAWWPDRPNSTDREYFAFAALLGFRFLYVPRSHVHYNKWSTLQISNATGYPARIAALRALFGRLSELAERPDVKPRITREHRLFLEQSWDLWRLSGGTSEMINRDSSSPRLLRRASGQEFSLTPTEAIVADALLAGDGEARALAHLVLAVADRAPAIGRDYAAIMTALQRLVSAGILEREIEPEAEAD